MQESKQENRSLKTLEQKQTWYSPVAEIYAKARPAYPSELIRRAIALAQLDSNASILELGSGPGNATIAFAEFGFSITCLEVNPDFCAIAQRNCTNYPNVQIHNTAFETWNPEGKQFDAVLAANAFHWIPPEIKFEKSAEVLREKGSLVLLWNMTPEPRYEIYQAIVEVYQAYAPSLVRYEGTETQAEIVKGFGQEVLSSGYFEALETEQIVCKVNYEIEDYLTLLSTLRKLEPQIKELLFAGLREKLKPFGDRIELSFLSAIQVARKAIH